MNDQFPTEKVPGRILEKDTLKCNIIKNLFS